MAVSFSLRAHPLGGLSCRDHRKVDLGVSGSIEVVREDVQRHVRDDLGDFAVRETSIPDTRELLVADAAAALKDGHRDLERRVRLRVRCLAFLTRGELVVGQSRLAAQRAMGRKAIVAGIGLSDGEGDLLLQRHR
jgi:hypothetical protein